MAEKVQIIIEATDKASGVIKGIGGAFQGIGNVISGILGAAVIQQAGAAIVDFAKGSIDAASDLNETLSKTTVLFGESADEMIKWAEGSATAVGLSTTAALDAAGMFAIFGDAAGLAGDDLNKFATENVQLAADMASFFNTSVEDASLALQSAFRGETEPIRRYGILLDDATMRQKALEMGIISTTKQALTPQQKILAANALIFEQTSAAQGDFARTSDGLANSQRIFAAQLDNVQMQLGTIFLPIVTDVMQVLNTQGIPALMGIVDAIGMMYMTLQEGTPFLDALYTAFVNLQTAIEPIAIALLTVFAPAFEQARIVFIQISEQIGGMLLDSLNQLTAWVKENGPLIIQFGQLVSASFQNFMQAVMVAWNVIKPILSGLFNIILQLGTLIMQVATGDWAGAWNSIVNIAQTAGAALWQSFVALFNGVTQLMGTTTAQVAANWAGAWNNLVQIVDKVKAIITAKVVEFAQIGVNIVTGLWNGMMSKINAMLAWVQGIASRIADTFANVLQIQSPSRVFEGFGENIMAGLANGINASTGMATSAVGTAAGVLPSALPSPAGMGGGGTVVNLTYAPAVSLASQQEVESVLLPFIRKGVRDVQAGR